MDDKWLRDRLVNIKEEYISDIESPVDTTISNLSNAASQVMTTYQNANKWLDTIKERLLMNHGSVFFSNYIHNLAHTMPVRFDKFGDILHTADIEVPYPPTAGFSEEIGSVSSSFSIVISILKDISTSLRNFIKIAQDTEHHAMACSAEELLVDIEGEFTHLYRMQRACAICSDTIAFDKWVDHYVSNKDNLLG